MASDCEMTVVDDEIDALIQEKNVGCKVIRDIGDYAYVIAIRDNDGNIDLKLQLEATYPTAIPNLIVRLPKTDGGELENNLLSVLLAEAHQMIGRNMLLNLVTTACNWVHEHCVTVESRQHDIIKVHDSNSRRKKTKEIHHKDTNADKLLKKGKLASMKTTQDVISRISWDADLTIDHFSIGYIDRFLGVIIKPFSVFSWDDIASVDYSVTAIPQHRIQFFLYKDVKVWDKSERLDNVFGSTGSGITITDVIAQERDKPCSKPDTLCSAMANDAVDKSEGSSHQKKPTHFLALRITNTEVINTIRELQTSVLTAEPNLERHLTPMDKLHITLCCLGLDTAEQIEHAVNKMNSLKVDTWYPENIELTVRGIENFSNRVLYAAVEACKEFENFVLYLRACLKEACVEIRDRKQFTPHMTLLKLWKPQLDHMQIYSNYEQTLFGNQTFDNIHLCKMSTEAALDGFYISPANWSFI